MTFEVGTHKQGSNVVADIQEFGAIEGDGGNDKT